MRFVLFTSLNVLAAQGLKVDGEVNLSQLLQRSENSPLCLKKADNLAKRTVTVFYESLCPDSVAFFDQHLKYVLDPSEKHPGGKDWYYQNNSVEVCLQPYGNVNTETGQCQHGIPECYENRLQACVIAGANDTLVNFRQQKEVGSVISCMMLHNQERARIAHRALLEARPHALHNTPLRTEAKNYPSITHCLQNVEGHENLFEAADECGNGEEGQDLHEAHGRETHSLQNAMAEVQQGFHMFVPFILVDGQTLSDAETFKDFPEKYQTLIDHMGR